VSDNGVIQLAAVSSSRVINKLRFLAHCFALSLAAILELCDECDCEGTVLPSLESFAERWRLPKVNYLFYHYFYRAVVGDTNWKGRLSESKRLGPVAIEAYAHATLRNQYFAWLFEYKVDNPGTGLKTEYDMMPEGVVPDDEEQHAVPPLFCASLDLLEVSVPTTTNTTNNDSNAEPEDEPRDDFKLLLLNEHGEGTNEYKAAVEHDKAIAKEIKRRIDEDRTRDHDDVGSVYTSSLPRYVSMIAKLQEDAIQATSEDTSSKKKRRRASRDSMRKFTDKKRKTKKESNAIQGWTDEGKRYMDERVRELRRDEQSGVRFKWESMYRKLWAVAKQADEDNGDDDDGEAPFEMDEGMLYAEI